jgi:acetyl esterase/lipase
VASLGYTLAPEARFPTQLLQGNAALTYLKEHAANWGGDPTRFFIGGDSAGAHIASLLTALQTDPKLASALQVTPALTVSQLRGAVLFCGIYDMSTVGSSGFPGLRTFLWAYTGYRDWMKDPMINDVSTTSHITNAYPPTFIAVGDTDPFQSQAFELTADLRGAGVPVTTNFWNGTGAGLYHEYQFNFTTPQAQKTYRDTLTFLSKYSKGKRI